MVGVIEDIVVGGELKVGTLLMDGKDVGELLSDGNDVGALIGILTGEKVNNRVSAFADAVSPRIPPVLSPAKLKSYLGKSLAK